MPEGTMPRHDLGLMTDQAILHMLRDLGVEVPIELQQKLEAQRLQRASDMKRPAAAAISSTAVSPAAPPSTAPPSTALPQAAKQTLSECEVKLQKLQLELDRYTRQQQVEAQLKELPHRPSFIQSYHECLARTHKRMNDMAADFDVSIKQLSAQHSRLSAFETNQIIQPNLGDEILYQQIQAEQGERNLQIKQIEKIVIDIQNRLPSSSK
jgi:hypothetical protein